MLATEKLSLENTITEISINEIETAKERIKSNINSMASLFKVELKEYQDKIPELVIDENFSTAAYVPEENKFIFNPKYLDDLGTITEEVTHFLRCLYHTPVNKELKDTYFHVHEFFGGLGRALVTKENVTLNKEHTEKINKKIETIEEKLDEKQNICLQKLDNLIDVYEKSILECKSKIEEIDPLRDYNTLLKKLEDKQEDKILKKMSQYMQDNSNLSEDELKDVLQNKLLTYLLNLEYNIVQNRFKRDELITKKYNIKTEIDMIKLDHSASYLGRVTHEIGYSGAQNITNKFGAKILTKYPNLIRESDKKVEKILYKYA